VRPTTGDWRTCTSLTRSHGRTFYFASQLLPPAKRRAIHAAYAFCRVADDLVDASEVLGPELVETRLAAWEAQLDAPRDPIALAYAHTRHRYGIPMAPTHDLFAGMRMDLHPRLYATWGELEDYCYRVAGTVGLISAPILGLRSASALPRAVELGIAMQLTNILRDVAEDAMLGRLYLPLEDLAAFGTDPESILAGRPNGDFPGLIEFEIGRARAYYEAAHGGIPELDLAGQVTTLASSHLYGKILHQIEGQKYDVFTRRAHVPTSRKLREMPVIFAALLRMRLQTPV
jgi:phytoene synthase